MQKFKLEADFISKDDHLVKGDIIIDGKASREFVAACLFQIIESVGEKDRKTVEMATTKYYKKVLGL